MKTKATSLLSIKSALKDRCTCGQECLEKVNFKAIRELRNSFWYNSKTVRMQLLKYYISHSKKIGRFRIINVEQFTLCSKAFCSVFRVNKNTFSRAINMNNRNVATIPGKNPRDMSGKTLILMNWLEDYGTYHGDRMPDTVDILLPYKTVKTDLYWKYSIETRQWSEYPVSKSQFFKIWEKHFPHLKIKKTNSFSKCTTCTTLERQLEKTTCVQTRAQYKKQKDEHNSRQMLERKYYYRKRDASRKNSDAYMSLIVDGMDQSKTNLPHFTGRLPKNIKGADLLKTHITGVINHGHGGFHTYVDLNEYPHDPNLTINVLLKMLKRTAQQQENQLPPVLYIQADNCGRENKNRYVLAFCELLVTERVFDEVHLSFLYVGHTHEDVDAAFSHIAEKLRKTDVEVLQDLLDLIQSSEMIDIMFDVKNWLLPEIKQLVGVSVPLHYKFSRVNDKVSAFYKGQHNCPWIQMEESILKSTPKGEPSILAPDFSNIDKQKQLRQVETVKHLFRKSSTLSKWQEFYKKLGETPGNQKENVIWILKELPRQKSPEMIDDVEIPEEIRKQIEKETVIPKVTVKKPKRPAQTAVSSNKRDSINKKRKIQNSGTRNKEQSKKKSQTNKTKSSSRGQTHKRLRKMSRTCRFILIPLQDEVKRHIWIIILLDLFERYMIMLLLLYIFLNYLRLCCLFEMLHYLMALFSCLVETHIGHLALSIRIAYCVKYRHKVSCVT